ncbi:MAG: type IV pilin-like G/H family protein [Pseudanabaena sp. ELA607]|jgi:type II secretory pathway pseudopilin PulG
MSNWRKDLKLRQSLTSLIISLSTSLMVSLLILLFFYTHQPAESQVQSALLSQMAGTWKIESVAGSPPTTVVISPEGNFIVVNPMNPKEALELMKIRKMSDSTNLPEGVTLQTIPMQISHQAHKAKQSEARTYVSTMNRGQQAYFLENKTWGKNIDALGIGINSETADYRYSTKAVPSIQTLDSTVLESLKIKSYPGIAVQTGIAKQEKLKSYMGVVYLKLWDDKTDLTTMSILCQSKEPTMKEPDLPKFDGKTMQCPNGYENVNHW